MKYILKFKSIHIFLTLWIAVQLQMRSQEAYFVDGFHGGVWGHYPEGYTEYMLFLLDKYPEWRLNLEIEPETWDRALKIDRGSYRQMQKFLEDTSVTARVEYVNPTYGQPYMFNVSGESIIRQFSYGMEKLKTHFPDAVFNTYSSEEPCFTSALPQILRSFGYKYASLKNPNTCWGGYTRAYGGELVNWVGSDGSNITTVPRYEIESLKANSTWETIGNSNSPEYINAAFDYGIKNPVGMTLQDAGWKWGPWLKKGYYKPSIYTTWRNYFENVVDLDKVTDWKLDQEDILVSLVWGSQVLQRIAQQVREAENNLLQAEKVAVIQNLESNKKYPSSDFDKGWQELLLAQHHDCWIVPYNEKRGDTWADKVMDWTNTANLASNAVYNTSALKSDFLKVYNTSGFDRDERIEIQLPKNWYAKNVILSNASESCVEAQRINDSTLAFNAQVPSYGYQTYHLKMGNDTAAKRSVIINERSGNYLLETDYYKISIDKNTGTIYSLIAKKLDDKEFIDQQSDFKFNSLRGHFYKDGGFKNNLEKPAKITVLEENEMCVKISIETNIAGNSVTQNLTLTQNEPRIDFGLIIDWKNNSCIGAYEEKDYDAKSLKKAFYNDKYKLLSLFPLNLEDQKVFKNSPFDAMQSELENTFFSSWDAIKNNIILDWVDVTDGQGNYGMALFSDHTTSYVHGQDFPLALTVQYNGQGLWGRHYSVDGPTQINYSLIPHRGKWREAGIWKQNQRIQEPLKLEYLKEKPAMLSNSLLNIEKADWILSSVYQKNNDTYIRIFNAEGDAETGKLRFGFNPNTINLVELDGREIKAVELQNDDKGYFINLQLPQFGFKTLKINN